MIKIVSGYIPLPKLRNVSVDVFMERGRALGRAIAAANVSFCLFDNDRIEDCWAYDFCNRHGPISPSFPTAADRFPDIETQVQSCIIMHQKQEWMCRAAIEDPEPDVFVWIDYGVLKQQHMSEAVVTRFCERLAQRYVTSIELPGIKPHPYPVDNAQCWDRFCGSVVIEPRDQLFRLARAMKATTQNFIRLTRTINIESNTMAEIEYARWPDVLFRWYAAEWGAPMFDNLPGS